MQPRANAKTSLIAGQRGGRNGGTTRGYGTSAIATQLWFDQHLKKTFRWPETPVTKLDFRDKDGIPSFTVTPDRSKKIVSVDVFYAEDTDPNTDREGVIHRFWHHATASRQGGQLLCRSQRDLPQQAGGLKIFM